MLPTLSPLDSKRLTMNELTTWLRLSVCGAAWLAAAGLHGCGGSDAGRDAPAPDDFRHAHVLASEYQQPGSVLSSASPDLYRGWGATQPQKANDVLVLDTQKTNSIVAKSSPNPSSGWTPQQFQAAYNVPLEQHNKPPGYGVKVAIITAYHYSSLQSDLNKWASQFNIKPISLNIINQAGNVTNSNWALATNIAVQMLNTVSPGATVYVIEAKSVSQTDMRMAIQTAVNLGANIVSMPFGADETSVQGSYAHLFSANNVVWIAPSGVDTIPSFPATYPDVIAVGGTTLSSVTPFVETAWSGAGAGISLYENMPSFQRIPSVQKPNTTAYRSVPDVAFNADPRYGAQIYTSILGGWSVVGGTSVSTGFFAGVVALVNASRKFNEKQLVTSNSTVSFSLQRSLYRLTYANGGPTNSTVLKDVVDGYAGYGPYPAGPGYDIATGVGSLNVKNFIDYMDTE